TGVQTCALPIWPAPRAKRRVTRAWLHPLRPPVQPLSVAPDRHGPTRHAEADLAAEKFFASDTCPDGTNLVTVRTSAVRPLSYAQVWITLWIPGLTYVGAEPPTVKDARYR